MPRLERSARAQTMTPLLPFVVVILPPSLHPDALYSEEVINLALDRIDGVDSDSFGPSTKLPRSLTPRVLSLDRIS